MAGSSNRDEIAALRKEISSLLTTNGQLHQHLGQLNGYLPAGSPVPLPARPSEGPLQDREPVTEPCQWPANHSAPPVTGTPAPSSAAALAAMLRERDDLQQRLQATELARCAAQQRRSTAEAALQRATEDLERQRKLMASHAAQDSANEADLLRQQLREAQEKLEDLDGALTTRSQRIRANEREYAELRVEYDGLAAANEAIRKELTATRSRIAAEQQGCRAAEAELSECQAQMRAGEMEFAAELESLANRRRGLEVSLRNSSLALADAEAEVAETRTQSLGLRAQLEVLEAARDEIAAQEYQSSLQQREEVKRLESVAEGLSSEAKDLSQRRSKALASLEELQKAQARRESENAQENSLCRARAAAAERCKRAREEVAEAEQRLGALLRQLGEERRQGLELARELTAAQSSAAAAGVPLQAKPVRRSRSAKAKSTKVTSSWPSNELQETWSASTLRMHRELEMLQRWKSDALSVLKQMQVDVSSAQEKYRQQLDQNQSLQKRLEHMGLQASQVLNDLPGSPAACRHASIV